MVSAESSGSRTLWRVFPWDPDAPDGAPFSPAFIPPVQGSGRFDLGTSPVLYLAESAEHAIGEVIQPFRGRLMRPAHLRRFGKGLALVAVTVAEVVVARVADLTDPATLLHHGVRPDVLAGHDTQRTQAIARILHAAGLPGFRWWSALSGDWHTIVLFLDRPEPDALVFATPELLSLELPMVRVAAEILGVRIRGG
ncbi:hypothetical protein BH24GEM3_BH24GEM3_19760 [soil metagenome]